MITVSAVSRLLTCRYATTYDTLGSHSVRCVFIEHVYIYGIAGRTDDRTAYRSCHAHIGTDWWECRLILVTCRA